MNNGENARADVQWLRCGMYADKGQPPFGKRGISARLSTIRLSSPTGETP